MFLSVICHDHANGLDNNFTAMQHNDTLPRKKVEVVDFEKTQGLLIFQSPGARRTRGL